MINERSKNVAVTVICILLMCFFVLSAILYAEGYYDFSFIRRTVIETDPPETEAPAEEPVITPPRNPAEAEILEGIPLLSVLPDYHPTSALYQKGKTILTRIEIRDIGEGTPLYTGKKSDYELTVTEEKSGKKVYSYTASESKRRTVEVYMGYFIVKEKGGLCFYNAYGAEVVNNYTGPEPVPAYERDAGGRPLFLIDGSYYYIDELARAFAPSSSAALHGIAHEFPASADNGGTTVLQNGNDWGYKNADGKTILSGYARTYPFSEGLGFADKGEKSVYVDASGKTIISGLTPVGREREAIAAGTVYFDNGHVIVRHVAYNRAGKCTEDRELLINRKGEEFRLPIGCTLVSYSNGRILLERDGKYGFFAVKGDWIADTEYTYAEPFSGGLAVIGRTDGKKAVIDMDGDIVLDFFYTDIALSADGVIAAWREDTGFALFAKAERNAD